MRAGILVYFHNHSQQGPPLVLLPAENKHNRWSFNDKGYLIREPDYVDTLVPLKEEGLYVLEEPIYLSREEFIPDQTLVQLGYNRSADPILFLAQFENTAIFFPDSGLKCTTEVFDLLREADFRLPGDDVDRYH